MLLGLLHQLTGEDPEELDVAELIAKSQDGRSELSWMVSKGKIDLSPFSRVPI